MGFGKETQKFFGRPVERNIVDGVGFAVGGGGDLSTSINGSWKIFFFCPPVCFSILYTTICSTLALLDFFSHGLRSAIGFPTDDENFCGWRLGAFFTTSEFPARKLGARYVWRDKPLII